MGDKDVNGVNGMGFEDAGGNGIVTELANVD